MLLLKYFSVPYKSMQFTTRRLSINKTLSFLKKEPQVQTLLDEAVVYELQTHNVLPNSVTKYLTNYENTVQLLQSRKSELPCDLVGSWTVQVGDLDQALHLWRHPSGFEGVDRYNTFLSGDASYQSLLTERRECLRSQSLQYLVAFTYWPPIQPRAGKNLYEIRSYSLKPGSIVEWGNNWSHAIKHWQSNDERFAGFLAQIGELFYVHHIWCYPSLFAREMTMQSAFESEGWNKRLAYIIPLIRKLQSRIIIPTLFSPTQ